MHKRTEINNHKASKADRVHRRANSRQFASHLGPESAGRRRSHCLRGRFQQNPRLAELVSLLLHDGVHITPEFGRAFHFSGFTFFVRAQNQTELFGRLR